MAKVRSPNAAKAIIPSLEHWAPSQEELERIRALSQQSLDTVTHLTEYQDEKASRTLTAMAFLSAFAVGMFAVIEQQYPAGSIARFSNVGESSAAACLIVMYLGFGVYALLLVIGAALVVLAIRPKFQRPKGWTAGTSGRPASFLFFVKMLETRPEVWAKAFTDTPSHDLQLEYTKNNILESYLIAQKIRDKLKLLQPGVLLLACSTFILAAWLSFGVLILIRLGPVPSQPRASSNQVIRTDDVNRAFNQDAPASTHATAENSRKKSANASAK